MDEITQSSVPMRALSDPDRQALGSRGDWFDHDRGDLIPSVGQFVADVCALRATVVDDVNAMRTSLLHHQPPSDCDCHPIAQAPGDLAGDGQPTVPVSGDAVGAADEGQIGWSAWIGPYAAGTSVLAGPHVTLDSEFTKPIGMTPAPPGLKVRFERVGHVEKLRAHGVNRVVTDLALSFDPWPSLGPVGPA